MMGINGITKEKYFAHLLGGKASGNAMHSIDEENDTSDDGSEGRDDSKLSGERRASFPALLPLHRELYPALFHLPKSFSLCNEGVKEDILPSIATDDESLQQELEEEHDLDERDGLLALQYEADLWVRLGNMDG